MHRSVLEILTSVLLAGAVLTGCLAQPVAPRVTGVSTLTPTAGGSLTVHGSGLAHRRPITVSVGGRVVPSDQVTVVSGRELEVTLPFDTPSGHLVVTNAAGLSDTFAEPLRVVSRLEVDPLEAEPGTRRYAVTARARDRAGEPVPGAPLRLSADAGTFIPGADVVTDERGEARATLDLTGVDAYVEVRVVSPPLQAIAAYAAEGSYPFGVEVVLADGSASMPVGLEVDGEGNVTVSTPNRRPAGPPFPAAVATVPAAALADDEPRPREVIVAYRGGPEAAALRRDGPAEALGLQRLASAAGLDLLRLPPGMAVEEAVARLESDPRVRYAEPNRPLHLAALPNDTHLYRQWGLFAVGAPAAWTVSDGGGVTVAVIDTGIDHAHPDLAGALVPGYDFCGDDGACATFDDDPHVGTVYGAHGTHVAGIVAAARNGYGTVGVAPGARVLPVKVFSEGPRPRTTTYAVALAIRWAAGLPVTGVPANPNPARVINLSLGGGDHSTTIAEAIADAVAAGAVVVAAVGNEGRPAVLFPASLPEVIGVGAIAEDWRLADYSNRGEGLDLVAPGSAVLSSSPGGDLAEMHGTSMATPHVAAVAALLLARDPSLTPQQVRDALVSTAYLPAVTGSGLMGAGVVRADGALGLPAPTGEADRHATVSVGGYGANLDLVQGVGGPIAVPAEGRATPLEVRLAHAGRELSGLLTVDIWADAVGPGGDTGP